MATTKEHSVLRDLASAYGQSEVGVALRALFDERDAIKQELAEARDALIREGMARDEWAKTSQGWEDMHAVERARHVETREALRAARADLAEAATLLSLGMSAGMDGTREREVWRKRRDALLAKPRASRSAPASAAPTGPLGMRKFIGKWLHENTAAGGHSHDLGSEDLFEFLTEWEAKRVLAPPAPEVPPVAAPKGSLWTGYPGDPCAVAIKVDESVTAEQVREAVASVQPRADAFRGKPSPGTPLAPEHFCECGQYIYPHPGIGCPKPAPCCPVALETHGLSHGDACPAGAALLPCPRCGGAATSVYALGKPLVLCARDGCDHDNGPPVGQGATMDAAEADWNRQVAACPAGAGKRCPTCGGDEARVGFECPTCGAGKGTP